MNKQYRSVRVRKLFILSIELEVRDCSSGAVLLEDGDKSSKLTDANKNFRDISFLRL